MNWANGMGMAAATEEDSGRGSCLGLGPMRKRTEVAAPTDRVGSAGDVTRGLIMRGLVGSTEDAALDPKRNEKS